MIAEVAVDPNAISSMRRNRGIYLVPYVAVGTEAERGIVRELTLEPIGCSIFTIPYNQVFKRMLGGKSIASHMVSVDDQPIFDRVVLVVNDSIYVVVRTP